MIKVIAEDKGTELNMKGTLPALLADLTLINASIIKTLIKKYDFLDLNELLIVLQKEIIQAIELDNTEEEEQEK